METALLCVITVGVAILIAAVGWMAFRRAPAVDWSEPFDRLDRHFERVSQSLRDEVARSRAESAASAKELRGEIATLLNRFGGQLIDSTRSTESARSEKLDGHARLMKESADRQSAQLASFEGQLNAVGQSTETRLGRLRDTLNDELRKLRDDNAIRLDQMRATVDEKLHATLEARLGESFKQVGDRLEQVHKGLGEMQALASGVGDLKKVLTNVKTRGTWGEVQLGNLLEQMLGPGQFEANVAVDPMTQERVDFAVKMPGRGGSETVWLPIDAKFPQEDFQRLVEASERGDGAAVEESAGRLEARILAEGRKIADKYIRPPHTTDFAVLFLATEGLYAEAARRPGLCDRLLQMRVVPTGPMTVGAILTSLQMGFRTVALEKQSESVRRMLGTVKTEFSKFGTVFAQVRKKLEEATNKVDEVARRTRKVESSLKDAESTPELPETPQPALPLLGDAALDQDIVH